MPSRINAQIKNLSKRHFAERLDVSVRTIDRWIAQRRIDTRTLKTGGIRIPESEIEKCFKPSIQEFLENGKLRTKGD